METTAGLSKSDTQHLDMTFTVYNNCKMEEEKMK
jgi:hypothetical protein